MARNSRIPIVAANWKMNTLPSEAETLIRSIYQDITSSATLVLFPPFTHISRVNDLKMINLEMGGQNASHAVTGAFTGQISCRMLKDAGCTFVLLGHSEAREFNSYENDYLPSKILTALEAGLKVIYCCGENMAIRENQVHFDFVKDQISQDLLGLDSLENIVIAYEPIWAIGTGLTATPEQAGEMHLFIRNLVEEKFGKPVSEQIRILYGGSVKASNADSLAQIDGIDGVLVGGASLIPEEFKSIIHAFEYGKR